MREWYKVALRAFSFSYWELKVPAASQAWAHIFSTVRSDRMSHRHESTAKNAFLGEFDIQKWVAQPSVPKAECPVAAAQLVTRKHLHRKHESSRLVKQSSLRNTDIKVICNPVACVTWERDFELLGLEKLRSPEAFQKLGWVKHCLIQF